jgi:ribA/ribD-fused uncharacterized protein
MAASDVTYFFKDHNPILSNWYMGSFTEPDGETFHSVEQYMMYHKALLMKDQVHACLIMRAKTPKMCKRLGRKVGTSHTALVTNDEGRYVTAFGAWDQELWEDRREQIVEDGLMLKFAQCHVCFNALMDTGYGEIVETSPYDKIWGAGLSLKLLQSGVRYKGLNLLGKALMRVRDRLDVE